MSNLDRRDLKIQALRERIGNLTVEHEDRAAEYRVEVTLLTEEVQNLRTENEDLRRQLEPTEAPEEDPDVPEEKPNK